MQAQKTAAGSPPWTAGCGTVRVMIETNDGTVARLGDPRLPPRFWAKVEIIIGQGCWLWTGSISTNGYGRLSVDGKETAAHRVFYEALVGPIPWHGKRYLDHLCRVRHCVNPDHVEPVTQQENSLRGVVSRGVARQRHLEPRRQGLHHSQTCIAARLALEEENMDAPTPPEALTETWRIRVTKRERKLVEKQAKRKGWPGYSSWLREHILWACAESLTAPELVGKAHEGTRSAYLTARFTTSQLKNLRVFASRHGLDLTAWARAIALTPNGKLKRL
jgi:hypothetical protein